MPDEPGPSPGGENLRFNIAGVRHNIERGNLQVAEQNALIGAETRGQIADQIGNPNITRALGRSATGIWTERRFAEDQRRELQALSHLGLQVLPINNDLRSAFMDSARRWREADVLDAIHAEEGAINGASDRILGRPANDQQDIINRADLLFTAAGFRLRNPDYDPDAVGARALPFGISRELLALVDDPSNQELFTQLRAALNIDAIEAEALARRLTTDIGENLTQNGEGRTQEGLPLTGEIEEFFKDQIITPALEELLRDGTISLDTRRELHALVRTELYSGRFAEWMLANHINPQDLTHVTDVIDTAFRALNIAQIQVNGTIDAAAVADRYVLVPIDPGAITPDVAQRARDIVANANLEANYGEVEADSSGREIDPTWIEDRTSSHLRANVRDLYEGLAAGEDLVIQNLYRYAQARARRFDGVVRRMTAVGGLPRVEGISLARNKLHAAIELHETDVSNGVVFGTDTNRTPLHIIRTRETMQRLEMHKISTEGVRRRLESALADIQGLNWDAVDEDDLRREAYLRLLPAIGILMEVDARNALERDEQVHLFRTTPDHPMGAEKTLLSALRVQVHDALTDGSIPERAFQMAFEEVWLERIWNEWTNDPANDPDDMEGRVDSVLAALTRMRRDNILTGQDYFRGRLDVEEDDVPIVDAGRGATALRRTDQVINASLRAEEGLRSRDLAQGLNIEMVPQDESIEERRDRINRQEWLQVFKVLPGSYTAPLIAGAENNAIISTREFAIPGAWRRRIRATEPRRREEENENAEENPERRRRRWRRGREEGEEAQEDEREGQRERRQAGEGGRIRRWRHRNDVQNEFEDVEGGEDEDEDRTWYGRQRTRDPYEGEIETIHEEAPFTPRYREAGREFRRRNREIRRGERRTGINMRRWDQIPSIPGPLPGRTRAPFIPRVEGDVPINPDVSDLEERYGSLPEERPGAGEEPRRRTRRGGSRGRRGPEVTLPEESRRNEPEAWWGNDDANFTPRAERRRPARRGEPPEPREPVRRENEAVDNFERETGELPSEQAIRELLNGLREVDLDTEIDDGEIAVVRAIEAAFPQGPVRREYIRLFAVGLHNRADAENESYTIDGDGRDAEVVVTAGGAETERAPLIDFLTELQPVMADRDRNRGIEAMFHDVYCNPIPEQVPDYYVEQAPTTDQFQITDENAREYILEDQLPFALRRNGEWYVNPLVVPFAYTNVNTPEEARTVNPRFRTGVMATDGESALFGQIAASAPNSEQQRTLYRTAATAILELHNRNRFSSGAPILVNDWLDAQGTDPNEDNTSLHALILDDHQNMNMAAPLRPENEQLLGYDASGDYSAMLTLELWESRIRELQDALADGNPQVSPNQVRWIEFLSYSVNTDLLLRNIRTAAPEPPTPPEPPAPTGPMARARRFARELISPEEPWTEVLENRIVPEEGVSFQEHIAPPTSIVRTVGEGHYRQRTVAPEDVQLEATVRFNRNSVQGVTDAFIGLFESDSDSVPVFDERIMRRLSIRTAQRELQRSIVQNPIYQDTQAAVAYIRNAHRGKNTGANILSVAIRGDDMRVLLNRDGAAIELVSGAEVPLGRNDHHVLVLNDALRRALPNYQDIIDIAQRVDLTTSEEISEAIINAAVARGGNPQDMSVLVSDFKALRTDSILDETISPDGRPTDEHAVDEQDSDGGSQEPRGRIPRRRVRVFPPLPHGPTTDILSGVLAADTSDYLTEETLHGIIDHFRGADSQGEYTDAEVDMVSTIIEQVPPGQRREDYLRIFVNRAAGLVRDNITYSPDVSTGRVTYQIPGQDEQEVPLLEFIVWLQPVIEGENTPYQLFNKIQGRPSPEIAYYIPDPFVTFDIPHPDIYVAAPYPFFEQGENGVWFENPDAAPFYYENPLAEDLERTSNLRFRTAFQATNGDTTARGSGLFALAASSVLLEEESIPRNIEGQAAYYRTLINSILKVHEDSTSNVLSDWLVAQGSNQAPPSGYEYPEDLSISHFIELDHVDGDLTQPRDANERLLAYIKSEGMGSAGNRSIYDHQATVRMWSDRIDVLNDLMAQDPADIVLLPHHVRWIEFLSHSVDINALVGDIGDEGSPPALPAFPEATARTTDWARRRAAYQSYDDFDDSVLADNEPAEPAQQAERGWRGAWRRARARFPRGTRTARPQEAQQAQEPQRNTEEDLDLSVDEVRYRMRGVQEFFGMPNGIFGEAGTYHHEGRGYRKSEVEYDQYASPRSNRSLFFFGVTESATYQLGIDGLRTDLARLLENDPDHSVTDAMRQAIRNNKSNRNRRGEPLGEQGIGFVVERNGGIYIGIDNVPNTFSVSVIVDTNGEAREWGGARGQNGIFTINRTADVRRAIVANQAVLDRVGGAQAAVDFVNTLASRADADSPLTPGALSEALIRHAISRGGDADEMSVIIANVGEESREEDDLEAELREAAITKQAPAGSIFRSSAEVDFEGEYRGDGATVRLATSATRFSVDRREDQAAFAVVENTGPEEGDTITRVSYIYDEDIATLAAASDEHMETVLRDIYLTREGSDNAIVAFVRGDKLFSVNKGEVKMLINRGNTEQPVELHQSGNTTNTTTISPRDRDLVLASSRFWEYVTIEQAIAVLNRDDLVTTEAKAAALTARAIENGAIAGRDSRNDDISVVVVDIELDGLPADVRAQDERGGREQQQEQGRISAHENSWDVPENSVLGTVVYGQNEVNTPIRSGQIIQNHTQQGGPPSLLLGVSEGPERDVRDAPLLGSDLGLALKQRNDPVTEILQDRIVNSRHVRPQEATFVLEREGSVYVVNTSRHTEDAPYVVIDRQTDEGHSVAQVLRERNTVTEIPRVEEVNRIFIGNRAFWRHFPPGMAAQRADELAAAGRTPEQIAEALLREAARFDGRAAHMTLVISTPRRAASPEPEKGEGPEAETQRRIRSNEISVNVESMFGSVVFGQHEVNTTIQSAQLNATISSRDGSMSLMIGVGEGTRSDVEHIGDTLMPLNFDLGESFEDTERELTQTILGSSQFGQGGSAFVVERTVDGERQLFFVNKSANEENSPEVVTDSLVDNGRQHAVRTYDGRNVLQAMRDVDGLHRLFIGNKRFWQHMDHETAAQRANELAADHTPAQIAEILIREAVANGGDADYMTLVIATPGQEKIKVNKPPAEDVPRGETVTDSGGIRTTEIPVSAGQFSMLSLGEHEGGNLHASVAHALSPEGYVYMAVSQGAESPIIPNYISFLSERSEQQPERYFEDILPEILNEHREDSANPLSLAFVGDGTAYLVRQHGGAFPLVYSKEEGFYTAPDDGQEVMEHDLRPSDWLIVDHPRFRELVPVPMMETILRDPHIHTAAEATRALVQAAVDAGGEGDELNIYVLEPRQKRKQSGDGAEPPPPGPEPVSNREVEARPGGPEVHAPEPYGSLEINHERSEDTEAITPPVTSGLTEVGYVRERGVGRTDDGTLPDNINTPLVMLDRSTENAPLMMAVYNQKGVRSERIRPLTSTIQNFGRLAAASEEDFNETIRLGCAQILGPSAYVDASLAIVRNNRLYALNKSGQNIVVVDTDGQVERLPKESMQVQERALDTLGMVIVGNPAFMDRIGDLQGAVDFIRSNGWDSVMAGRHLMEIAVANGGNENDMSVVVANVGEQKANEAAGPAAEVFEAQEPISLQEAQERGIHTREGVLDGNLTGYALSRFSGQGREIIADSDDRRNQTEAVFLTVESNASASRPDYLNLLQSELRTHQDVTINECIRRAVIERTPNRGSDRLSLAYVDGMTLYAASRDGNFPIVDRNGRVAPLPDGDTTVRQMELQVGDRVIVPTPHFRELVSDEDAVARIRGITNYNEASRTLVAMALDVAAAQGRSVQDDIRVYVTSAAELLGDERDTIRRDPTAPADAAESVPVTSTLEPARELTLEEAEALRIRTRGMEIERGNFVNYARGEHTRIPGNDSHTDASALAFHGGEEMIFIVSDEYQGNRPMENYTQMFADAVYEREGVDISDAIRSTILEQTPFQRNERLSVAYLDGTTLYFASRDDAFPVVDRNGQIVPTTEAGPQVRRVELEQEDRLIVTNPRFRDFVPLDVAIARIKDIKDPIRATRALLNLAVEAGAQEDDLKVFITSTGRERPDAAVVPSTTSAMLGAELELAAGEASAVQEPVSNEEAISLGINTTNYLLEDGNFRSYARSSFRGSDRERFATPRATDFNDGRELLMFVSEGDNETPLPQYREMLSRELGTGSNPDFRAAIREAILERPPSRGSENLSLAFTVGMTLYAVSRDDNFPLVDRGGHIVPLPPPTPGDDERIRQMQLQVGDRVIVRNARSRELVPDAVALARIRGIDSPHAAARTLVAMGVEAGEQEANISVYVTSPAQLRANEEVSVPPGTSDQSAADEPSVWQRLQASWQAREEGEHLPRADGRTPLRPSSSPSASAEEELVPHDGELPTDADVSGVPGETLSAQQASAAESDTQSAIAQERAQVEADVYYLPALPGEEPRAYAERLRGEFLEGADLVPGEGEIIDAIAASYPDPADEFSRNEFVRLLSFGLQREAWSGDRPEPPLRIEDGEVVYRVLDGWRKGQERRAPVVEYVLGLHPDIEEERDTLSLFDELLLLPDPQRVIHNIPENLSLVGRPHRELAPMYTYTEDKGWRFNRNTSRYATDFNTDPPRARNDARFLLAFDETDSRLLGWAAATGEVPSEQLRLYEALAEAVVRVHQENPELLRNWLRVQATVVQTQASDIPHTALELIQQDDHYEETSGLKMEAERMLGYRDGAYDEDRTVEIWTERIRMLPTALSLQPLQLTANEIAYFDFLSQSADVDHMIEDIITGARTNTPSSAPSSLAGQPAREALTSTADGSAPDGTPPGGGPESSAERGEGEIELINNTEEAPAESGLHTVSTSQYFAESSVVVNRPEVRFNIGPNGDPSETMLQVYQYSSIAERPEIPDYPTILPKGEVTQEAIRRALESHPDTAQEAIAYIQSSIQHGEEEVTLHAINRKIDGPAVIVVGEDGQMAELSSHDMDVQGRRLFPGDRIIVASSEVIARVGLQQAADIVAAADSTAAASAALAQAAVKGMNGRSEYQNSFSVLVADLPRSDKAVDAGTQLESADGDRVDSAVVGAPGHEPVGTDDPLGGFVRDAAGQPRLQVIPRPAAGTSETGGTESLDATVAGGEPGPEPVSTPESRERLAPVGIEYTAATEVGVKREQNQDAYFTPEGMYIPLFHPSLNANLNEPLTDEQQRAQAATIAAYLQEFTPNYYSKGRPGYEVTDFTEDRILEAQGRIRELIASGELEGFAITADGMGGTVGGEIASSITTLGIVDYIGRHWSEEVNREELLTDAIEHTHNLLVTMMQRRPQLESMGTTVIVALTDRNGETFGATLGDSRAIKRNRADNTAKQLTIDNSLIATDIRDRRVSLLDSLSHPLRSKLTAAVGDPEFSRTKIHTFATTLRVDKEKGLDEQLDFITDGVWEGIHRENTEVVKRIKKIQSEFEQDIIDMSKKELQDSGLRTIPRGRAEEIAEEALLIAQGKMFISFNVNTQVGNDFLRPTAAEEADLSKHLTRRRIQELSADNTTALTYTPKKHEQAGATSTRTADTVEVAVAGSLSTRDAERTGGPEALAAYPYIAPESGERLDQYAERVRGDRDPIPGEQLAIRVISSSIPGARNQYEYTRLLTQAVAANDIPSLRPRENGHGYVINDIPVAQFIIDLQPELEDIGFVDRLRGIIAQPNPDRPGFVNEVPAQYPPIDNPEDYIVDFIYSYYVAQRGPDGSISHWNTNSDAHPFVTYENPNADTALRAYNYDLRFWSTLRRGEGGSVFALAAASAPTPEDQVRLYGMLAEGIVDIYQQSRRSDSQLVRRLVQAQGDPDNPASAFNHMRSSSVHTQNDLIDQFDVSIDSLARLLAEGRQLTPRQRHFVDILASGVNVTRLLDHIAHPQGEGGPGPDGSAGGSGTRFDWSTLQRGQDSGEGGSGGPPPPDRGSLISESLNLNVGPDLTESTAHAPEWSMLGDVTEASYNPKNRTVDSTTFTELDVNDKNNVSFLSVYESPKQEQPSDSEYEPYPWLPTGYRSDFNELLLGVGASDIPRVLTGSVIDNDSHPTAQGSVVVVDTASRIIYAINKNVETEDDTPNPNAVVVVNRGGLAVFSSGEPNKIDAIDIERQDTDLIMATPKFWERVTPERAVELINDSTLSTQEKTARLLNEAFGDTEGGRDAMSVIVTSLKEPEKKSKSGHLPPSSWDIATPDRAAKVLTDPNLRADQATDVLINEVAAAVETDANREDDEILAAPDSWVRAVGITSEQGADNDMGDAYIADVTFGSSPTESLFAVFNRTGRTFPSRYIKNINVSSNAAGALGTKLNNALEEGIRPELALIKAFKEVDGEIDSSLDEFGATAAALYFHGDEVSVANVGTTRVTLLRDGSANVITKRHLFSNDKERDRLLRLVGDDEAEVQTTRNDEGYYVMGKSETSGGQRLTRALGLHDFPGIIATPDTSSGRLEPGDRFIVADEAEFWSRFKGNEQEVYAAIRGITNAKEASDRLKDLAREKGTSGNLTIMVVDTKVPTRPAVEDGSTEPPPPAAGAEAIVRTEAPVADGEVIEAAAPADQGSVETTARRSYEMTSEERRAITEGPIEDRRAHATDYLEGLGVHLTEESYIDPITLSLNIANENIGIVPVADSFPPSQKIMTDVLAAHSGIDPTVAIQTRHIWEVIYDRFADNVPVDGGNILQARAPIAQRLVELEATSSDPSVLTIEYLSQRPSSFFMDSLLTYCLTGVARIIPQSEVGSADVVEATAETLEPGVQATRMTDIVRDAIIDGLSNGSLNKAGVAALRYLNDNGIFEVPQTEGPILRESRDRHAALVSLNVDNRNILIAGKKDDPGEQIDDIESVLTAELDPRLEDGERMIISAVWLSLNEHVNDGFRFERRANSTHTLRLSREAARALIQLRYSTNSTNRRVAELARSIFHGGVNWENSEAFLQHIFTLVTTPEAAVTVVSAEPSVRPEPRPAPPRREPRPRATSGAQLGEQERGEGRRGREEPIELEHSTTLLSDLKKELDVSQRRGEILEKAFVSPNVLAGFLQSPEHTAAIFPPGTEVVPPLRLVIQDGMLHLAAKFSFIASERVPKIGGERVTVDLQDAKLAINSRGEIELVDMKGNPNFKLTGIPKGFGIFANRVAKKEIEGIDGRLKSALSGLVDNWEVTGFNMDRRDALGIFFKREEPRRGDSKKKARDSEGW